MTSRMGRTGKRTRDRGSDRGLTHSLPPTARPPRGARLLLQALSKHFLFSAMAAPEMQRLIDLMAPRRLAPGEALFDEGGTAADTPTALCTAL